MDYQQWGMLMQAKKYFTDSCTEALYLSEVKHKPALLRHNLGWSTQLANVRHLKIIANVIKHEPSNRTKNRAK